MRVVKIKGDQDDFFRFFQNCLKITLAPQPARQIFLEMLVFKLKELRK
jgi:hypothetical protein